MARKCLPCSSIKYTLAGSIKVRLRLGEISGSPSGHNGQMLLLQVSDTGKGIAAHFLATKLFTPFAQVFVLFSLTSSDLTKDRKTLCRLERASVCPSSAL